MRRKYQKNGLITDYEILTCIYAMYSLDYTDFQKGAGVRQSKIYVPIDIDAIAAKLNMEGDLLFARLYSYLNDRHGVNMNADTKSPLFSLKVGSDTHCIHFPLLASVLADIKQRKKRDDWTRWISVAALSISITSLIVSILTDT